MRAYRNAYSEFQNLNIFDYIVLKKSERIKEKQKKTE